MTRYSMHAEIFLKMESKPDIAEILKSFTPKMEVNQEFHVLREARKSLGGASLRPIEIDMDILADAYPQEAKFMKRENVAPADNAAVAASVNPVSPKTPNSALKPGLMDSPKMMSGRKTPNRRFFKTESEREYARNLMKEFVQLYILQGVHGKDAFRRALVETKKRIHLRRGEDVPTSPMVTSPIQESPYPKLSPPREVETPYSQKKQQAAIPVQSVISPKRLNMAAIPQVSPSRRVHVEPVSIEPITPSRVKSMVAAIQSSPVEAPPSGRKSPTSSRKVKAVSESIEAVISQATPGGKGRRVLAKHDSIQEETSGEVARSIEASVASVEFSDVMSPRKTVKVVDPVSPTKAVRDVVDPPRSSARIRKAQQEVSPTKKSQTQQEESPARKNQTIVEHASPSRKGKKAVTAVVDVSDDDAAPSPPAGKRVRRAAAIAAVEAMEPLTRSSRKKEPQSEAESTTSKRTRSRAAEATTARKNKKVALETIPENQAVVVPVRPRKAKTTALIKK